MCYCWQKLRYFIILLITIIKIRLVLNIYINTIKTTTDVSAVKLWMQTGLVNALSKQLAYLNCLHGLNNSCLQHFTSLSTSDQVEFGVHSPFNKRRWHGRWGYVFDYVFFQVCRFFVRNSKKRNRAECTSLNKFTFVYSKH